MKRTIKVSAQSNATINLIITVGESKEEVKTLIEKIKGEEEIVKILNVAKVRCEEENKYLQIKGSKLQMYQQLLNYILQRNSGYANDYNNE